MEKKVRYLMLLLCLFLFPFRVHAEDLEPDTEPKNESSTIVVKYSNNEINQVDQTDPTNTTNEVTDVVGETNPTNVPTGNDNVVLNEKVGETNNEELKTEPVLQDTKKVNLQKTNINDEQDEQEVEDEKPAAGSDGQDEEDEVQPTLISTFVFSNVNVALIEGQAFAYSGASAESDKYTVVAEAWGLLSEDNMATVVNTSNEAWNEGLKNSNSFSETVSVGRYLYEATVQLTSGNELAYNASMDNYCTAPGECVEVIIDGQTYAASVLPGEVSASSYRMVVLAEIPSRPPEVTYDPLTLQNVETEVYVGKGPSYGTTTGQEDFQIESDCYFWGETVDGKRYLHVITNNPEALIAELEAYDEEYRPVLSLEDSFLANHVYTHVLWISTPKNHAIANLLNDWAGSYNERLYVTINGEEVDGCYADVEESENKLTYIIYLGDITPVLEQSASEEETATQTVSVYTASLDEPTPTHVDNSLSENPDNKLETKKDVKKEKNEEPKKDDKNTGLLIFLIILVVIAIAIPITVYKRKQ